MLVQDYLENSAARHPEKVALVCGEQRFTYSQLDAMANRLANSLRMDGVRRGSFVGIHLHNSLEAVVSIFAVLKADATFVVINRNMKTEKLTSILNNCDAVALLTDQRVLGQVTAEGLMEKVGSLKSIVCCGGSAGSKAENVRVYADVQSIGDARRPVRKGIDLDLACLIYTSGTTGEPKGVMCGHSNIVFVNDSIVSYLKHRQTDVVLSVLPLAFSYGLYQMLATFAVGGTFVLEASFAFPTVVLERMAKERVTGFAGVPTIFSLLLGMDLAAYDLTSLRYLSSAAAALPEEHAKRLRQSFPNAELVIMHGLTEVARTMYLPSDQVLARPGSSGIAIPGTELWIESEGGERLGAGEIGELVVRGRHVMRGYWKDRALSAQRFRPGPFAGEQVCYSGDLFRVDEAGYFYFVARKDDIIKSRGEKVAPREVENAIYSLKGVQEAAVIGVPDPMLGQVIKAFVLAPGTGLTSASVIAHCKANLEDYMVPRAVEFVNEFPKTESGKIQKNKLR